MRRLWCPSGYGFQNSADSHANTDPKRPVFALVKAILGDESAYKPDSVAPEGAGGHPSATAVANGLRASACDLPDDSGEQPSIAVTGPKALLVLLRAGFTEPPQSPGVLVVSYTTVSP